MIERALKVLRKQGFKLQLTENNSGMWAWSAIALGDNVKMGPNGALYTRATGFGKTPEEALEELIAEVEMQAIEADCSDLF